MSLENKQTITKCTICALHYLGVNYQHPEIIKFINAFVKNELEQTKTFGNMLPNPLVYKGVELVTNNTTSKQFQNAYKLFIPTAGKPPRVDYEQYYNGLRTLKTLVVKMVGDDIRNHFNISIQESFFEIIGGLIQYNVQDPFKFKSVRKKGIFTKKFLTDMYDLYTVTSIEPYSYTENGELTIELKPQVIELINTHFSSKYKLPNHATVNYNAVRNHVNSLKSQIKSEYSNSIFIIPPAKTYIDLNGRRFFKTKLQYDQQLKIQQHEDIIVMDSLFFLNKPISNDYQFFFVDPSGSLAKYDSASGKFSTVGSLNVG